MNELDAINARINEQEVEITKAKGYLAELDGCVKTPKIKGLIEYWENKIKNATRIKNNIIVLNFF